MKLLIVESPAKAKTIARFVGSDYKVVSTNGHLFALSRKNDKNHEFGINFKTLKINNLLIPKRRKVFQNIKKQSAEATTTIFATDNDREGEAIAYTIAEKLKIDLSLANRLIFNEISKDSILAGLTNLQKINIMLVYSQKARRLMDRIIGFRVGKHLLTYYGSQGSGRVQSVVLKFVAENDVLLNNFIPCKYHVCRMIIAGNLILNNKKAKQDKLWPNYFRKYIQHPEQLELKISKITSKIQKILPPRPFKTSTFVQEAFLKFGYSSARTMLIAQQLYAGVKIQNRHYGLITYLRTDSTRVSLKFISMVKKFLGSQFYNDKLLPTQPQQTTEKTLLTQDAHEAIRVVYLDDKLPLVKIHKFLTNQQWNIYKMIYDRSLAMYALPVIKKNFLFSFIINNSEELIKQNPNEKEALSQIFTASASQYQECGWTQFYRNGEQEDKLLQQQQLIQKSIGDVCRVERCEILEKETKPIARFNQASLIKKMDETGIGRPSTYSSIIQKLQIHNYILQKQRKIFLTIRGRETNRIIQESYSTIFNECYTAEMERNLARICNAKYDYRDMIYSVNDVVKQLIVNAVVAPRTSRRRFIAIAGKSCQKCGNQVNLIRFHGADHLICSNFVSVGDRGTKTTTNNTNKDNTNKVANVGKQNCDFFEKICYFKALPIGRLCPQCKADLVVRQNSKRYNLFVACSKFPKCKMIINCRRDPLLQQVIKKLYPDEQIFF